MAGKLPHWVKKLHDQYESDVVRISPSELDIHGHHPDAQPFEKDPLVNGKSFNDVDNLLTAKHEDHERMRKVLGHAFSERAIREQEPMVQMYIEKLIRRLHEQIGRSSQGKVDLVKWYG